jgi:hypothetical protein
MLYNARAFEIWNLKFKIILHHLKKQTFMPILNVILVLIVVGVLLWLVNNYIPMDSKIKSILNGVVVIVVVLWLLKAFGVLGSLQSVHL